METIKVISHLEQTLRGRYNGKDYLFEPEKPTVLPLDAATFIFGLGQEDKGAALNQLGLLRPVGKYEDALAKLDQITFLEGKVVFEDEAAEEDDNHKVTSRTGRGNRTGDRRPQGNPRGGAEPDDESGPADPQTAAA